VGAAGGFSVGAEGGEAGTAVEDAEVGVGVEVGVASGVSKASGLEEGRGS
jgi:hypothetical protein